MRWQALGSHRSERRRRFAILSGCALLVALPIAGVMGWWLGAMCLAIALIVVWDLFVVARSIDPLKGSAPRSRP